MSATLCVCSVPDHSTTEFARLVSILQLQGSAWEWLTPCQQSGAPPPRDLLVRRCQSTTRWAPPLATGIAVHRGLQCTGDCSAQDAALSCAAC